MNELVYSAGLKLERKIDTHCFIICPNNSGSTFLKNALATSKHTWNLYREGQNTFGFSGPNTRTVPYPLLWAATPERLALFQGRQRFNWPVTRKAWYFQSFSNHPDASVFVEKSPPSLVWIDQLPAHFKNSKFLFMVRNPYAVVEGICRRKNRLQPDADNLILSAQHIMRCFALQRRNMEFHGGRGVFFTYEQMCEQPERVQAKIRALVPGLNDLVLNQRIEIKGIYDEKLRNMNNQQINRLAPSELARLSAFFDQHRDLMDYFGYSIIQL